MIFSHGRLREFEIDECSSQRVVVSPTRSPTPSEICNSSPRCSTLIQTEMA